MPPKRGPLWRGERAEGKARRVARTMRASSHVGTCEGMDARGRATQEQLPGCAVSEPPEHARKVGGHGDGRDAGVRAMQEQLPDGRRPRHRGCVSLVTFFAQALRRRSGANSGAGREAAEGRMPGVKKVTRSSAGGVEALAPKGSSEALPESYLPPSAGGLEAVALTSSAAALT